MVVGKFPPASQRPLERRIRPTRLTIRARRRVGQRIGDAGAPTANTRWSGTNDSAGHRGRRPLGPDINIRYFLIVFFDLTRLHRRSIFVGTLGDSSSYGESCKNGLVEEGQCIRDLNT